MEFRSKNRQFCSKAMPAFLFENVLARVQLFAHIYESTIELSECSPYSRVFFKRNSHVQGVQKLGLGLTGFCITLKTEYTFAFAFDAVISQSPNQFLRPACVLELANTSTDSQSVTSGVLIMRKLWQCAEAEMVRKLPDFLFRNGVAAEMGAS